MIGAETFREHDFNENQAWTIFYHIYKYPKILDERKAR